LFSLSPNSREDKLTEITDVSLVVRGTTVVLASGVEVTSGRGTAVASWSAVVQARNLEAYVLSPNSLLLSMIGLHSREQGSLLDVETSLGVGV
jgi:hypothetical protein